MNSPESAWLVGAPGGINSKSLKRIFISLAIGLSVWTLFSMSYVYNVFSARIGIQSFRNYPQTDEPTPGEGITVAQAVVRAASERHTLSREVDAFQELQYPVPPRVNRIDDILSMPKIQFDPRFRNPCWFEANTRRECTQHRDKHPPEECTVLKCLPYFYIIGVCKSGTTDLFNRLTKHPDVLPNSGDLGKETLWWPFTRLGTWIFSGKGFPRSFRQYIRTFDAPAKQILIHSRLNTTESKNEQLITGEGSPPSLYNLIHWQRIPQNAGLSFPKKTNIDCLAHLQPDAKLILLLRNPTERLYADYLFHFAHFRYLNRPVVKSTEHFHTCVLSEIDTLNHCVNRTRSLKACLYKAQLHIEAKVRIYTNFYAVYVKEWLKVFPRKSIFIMRTEDYSNHTRAYLAELLVFLNLRLSDDILDVMSAGERSYRRKKSDIKLGPMLKKTKNVLDKFYEKDNNDLAILLEDDRFRWP